MIFLFLVIIGSRFLVAWWTYHRLFELLRVCEEPVSYNLVNIRLTLEVID